jgi:SAM-dependent methyltransferase
METKISETIGMPSADKFGLNFESKFRFNGQFFTDMSLCERMVDLAEVKEGDTVYDPCCGSGRMLIAALKAGATKLIGRDNDVELVAYCKQNMPQDAIVDIACHDSMAFDENIVANKIITNIPFSVKIDGICEDIKKIGIKCKKSEIAFVQLMIARLAPNGCGCVIVPAGFLDNHGPEYVQIRQLMAQHLTIKSITELKGDVFLNTSFRSFIVCFTKTEPVPESTIRFNLLECKTRRKRNLNQKLNIVDKATGSILQSELNDEFQLIYEHYLNKLQDGILLDSVADFKLGVKVKKEDIIEDTTNGVIEEGFPIQGGGEKTYGKVKYSNLAPPSLTIGTVGKPGHVIIHNEPIFASDGCCIITPKEGYTIADLKSMIEERRNVILGMSTGSCVRNLSIESLKSLLVRRKQ